jgi:hypothetical protein
LAEQTDAAKPAVIALYGPLDACRVPLSADDRTRLAGGNPKRLLELQSRVDFRTTARTVVRSS